MKYKVGKIVIIIKNLEPEYHSVVQEILDKINYISTIKKIVINTDDNDNSYYLLEGLLKWHWKDYHIEGLVPEPKKFPELESMTRFELMEL